MKIEKEAVAVLVIIGLLLWIGNGALWGHEIEHDFPYGLSASDAFQHQARTESIKEMGNYRHEASYIVYGFDDVVGFYPPLMYHLSVMLSYATGLETYDTSFFMVFFLAVLAASAMYLLIRSLNEYVAILSIPMFIFLFINPLPAVYLWGQWPSAAAHVFLIAAVWSLTTKLKHRWLLLGLFSAAATLTHTAGAIFLTGFLGLYGAVSLIKKNFNEVKRLAAAGALAIVLSGYYLIIFQGTWMKVQKYALFTVERATESFPTIMPSHFGWAIFIVGIGMLFALLLKRVNLPVTFSAFMFMMGLTNYIGFAFRAFQLRFFWPAYLAVFFGLGTYQPSRFLPKQWKPTYSVLLSVILGAAILSTNSLMVQSQGLMDRQRWEGLQWLRYNTPEDAMIFYFYGDLYYQTSMLYNTHRIASMPHLNAYADALAKNEIKSVYPGTRASDSGARFPYRKGLWTFGFHDNEMEGEINPNICEKDYWVFDKVTAYPQRAPLINYNLAIRNVLLKNGEEVFSNEFVSIVKNNNPGGECIEE